MCFIWFDLTGLKQDQNKRNVKKIIWLFYFITDHHIVVSFLIKCKTINWKYYLPNFGSAQKKEKEKKRKKRLVNKQHQFV